MADVSVGVDRVKPLVESRFKAADSSGQPRLGLALMALGCCCYALMQASFYAAAQLEPGLSVPVGSFIRTLVNLTLLISYGVWSGTLRDFRGDGSPLLWMRGAFGTLGNLGLYFAMPLIGIGASAFLYSTNIIFIGLLGFCFLGQRTPLRGWLTTAAAFLGLYLLLAPEFLWSRMAGILIGVSAGLFSGLSHLMMARANRKNSAASVLFYLCVVMLIAHAPFLVFSEVQLPITARVWVLLIASGVAASAGQYLVMRAYRLAPANQNASVSLLWPVLSVAFGVMMFGNPIPSTPTLVGAAVILVCGVGAPLIFAKAGARADATGAGIASRMAG